MDQSKSARSDTPRIKLIKLSVNIIAPYVTKIFNLCILKGVFPESLKFAEVIPIFKSGSKAEVNNYRPISLLSPFAKIFESYIYSQLISFINKHNADGVSNIASVCLRPFCVPTEDDWLFRTSRYINVVRITGDVTINHN